MWVGEKVRVLKLERPSGEDRSAYEGRDGTLVRRLNVPWTPDLGALWEVRFEAGKVAVFAESEIGLVRDGVVEPTDMAELREAWGDAPRRASLPFRRFGAGIGAAPAILAFVVFSIAGVLLLWAGISEASVALAAAGSLLVLIGIGVAAVLVS